MAFQGRALKRESLTALPCGGEGQGEGEYRVECEFSKTISDRRQSEVYLETPHSLKTNQHVVDQPGRPDSRRDESDHVASTIVA
jgi:hypothetical protein